MALLGSMPPHSTSLSQEGAAIISFKLVQNGIFDEAGISALLMKPAGLFDSQFEMNTPVHDL